MCVVKRPSLRLVILLVVIVGLAFGLVTAGILQMKVNKAVSTLKISNAEITSISTTSGEAIVTVGLDVANPSDAFISLGPLTLTLTSHGKSLSTIHNVSLDVGPDSHVRLSLNMSSKYLGLIQVLSSGTAKLQLRVTGPMNAKLNGLFRSSSNLNSSVPVTVVQPQRATPESEAPPLSTYKWHGEKPFDVIDLKWIVDGKEVTQAPSGYIVTALIKIRSNMNMSGEFKDIYACLYNDIKAWPDSKVVCITTPADMKAGEVRTLRITSLTPSSREGLRGLYVIAGVDEHVPFGKSWRSREVYETPNQYPPRLKVVPGVLKIIDVYWLYKGDRVTEAVGGANVEGVVVFKAVTGLYKITISVSVWKDIAGWRDSILTSVKKEVTVRPGTVFTIRVPFTVKHESLLRGYYIQVMSNINERSDIGNHTDTDYITLSKIYDMKAAYPPRLKYVKPSFTVESVTWESGGTPVSSVKAGSNVVAIVKIKSDTGLANTPITFCVREDVAHGKDHDVACTVLTVSISPGSTYTARISFHADYHHKSYFIYSTYTRGYFIQVSSSGPVKYKWSQPSHYPPRLKVSK